MLQKVGVIGGGTMGVGIAAAFALHGNSVNLFEPSVAQQATVMPAVKTAYALLVEEAFITEVAASDALGRIQVFSDLAASVEDRDFVVEAIPERLDLKQELFVQLNRLCPDHTVIASNTSSLPLAPMLDVMPPHRRERMMVTHWYNPPLLMPIVELSFFGNMPAAIYDDVARLHQKIGKQTVKVLKDVPGLVANRIQQAVAREVFSLLEQNVAAAEDIDKALKFGPAFRYATTGQLEVSDFGGLDIWLTVGDNLLPDMDASTRANVLLRQKVAAGKLGVKSGEGFFAYDPAQEAAARRSFMKRLIHQLKASQAYI